MQWQNVVPLKDYSNWTARFEQSFHYVSAYMTFHDGTKSAQARIGLGAFFDSAQLPSTYQTQQNKNLFDAIYLLVREHAVKILTNKKLHPLNVTVPDSHVTSDIVSRDLT